LQPNEEVEMSRSTRNDVSDESELVKQRESTTFEYVKQQTWLERHVAWLRNSAGKKESGATRFFKNALAGVEAAVLGLSLVGIPALMTGVSTWQKQKAENDFWTNFKENKPRSPSRFSHIDIPSQTRAFNHINDYAIESGIIWYRRRVPKDDEPKDEWKPIYFDGGKNRKPVSIDVDGANLLVIDDAGDVHYKKILREYRVSEIGEKKDRHLAGHQSEIENLNKDDYVAVDKSDLNNWKDRWFSLPFVNVIVNLFAGKRLHIDTKEAKSVAIAHRGRYNDYIEDAEGQKHLVGAGVTTLYILQKTGREIRKYDPWSPLHADVRMYFPETATSQFTAEKIATSASTIMAVGYDVDTKTGNKVLKIITKLGDIDTEGWNPGLKYGYEKNVNDKDVRVLPIGMQDGKEWSEHALPEGVDVTSTFTVRQTGQGNNARMLEIEGRRKNEKGQMEWGILVKNITDREWRFVPNKDPSQAPENKILPKNGVVERQEEKNTLVHDYKGKCRNQNQSSYDVELKSFGEHSYHSTITIKNNGNTYDLPLYKKHGLASFLGKTSFNYEIAIPKQYQNDKFIQDVFSKKATENGKLKVSVQEKNGNVKISGGHFKIGVEKSMPQLKQKDVARKTM